MNIKNKIDFKNLLSDNTIICGGHFMIRAHNKSILNTGTILSFDIAVDIFVNNKNKKKNLALGILFNNIGTTCGGSNMCHIINDNNDNFIFPHEYNIILRNNKLRYDDLIIFWEKYLRNHGKKEFIKRIKTLGSIIENKEGYWLEDEIERRRYLLTRKSLKDPYGVPACPLIMAAYALEQEKMGYTKSLNFWYIGDDNFENIPNYFMIEKGRQVAKLLGSKMDILNIYFTKDKVITNF